MNQLTGSLGSEAELPKKEALMRSLMEKNFD